MRSPTCYTQLVSTHTRVRCAEPAAAPASLDCVLWVITLAATAGFGAMPVAHCI